jgi:hypothetical protein
VVLLVVRAALAHRDGTTPANRSAPRQAVGIAKAIQSGG